MKNYRKIVSILLSVSMIISSLSLSFAEEVNIGKLLIDEKNADQTKENFSEVKNCNLNVVEDNQETSESTLVTEESIYESTFNNDTGIINDANELDETYNENEYFDDVTIDELKDNSSSNTSDCDEETEDIEITNECDATFSEIANTEIYDEFLLDNETALETTASNSEVIAESDETVAIDSNLLYQGNIIPEHASISELYMEDVDFPVLFNSNPEPNDVIEIANGTELFYAIANATRSTTIKLLNDIEYNGSIHANFQDRILTIDLNSHILSSSEQGVSAFLNTNLFCYYFFGISNGKLVITDSSMEKTELSLILIVLIIRRLFM